MLVPSDVSITVSSAGSSGVSMTVSSADSSGVSIVEQDAGYQLCQHDSVHCLLPVVSAWRRPELVTSGVSTAEQDAGY